MHKGDSPPPYTDAASAQDTTIASNMGGPADSKGKPQSTPEMPMPSSNALVGPSSMPPTTVYHYHNPLTNEHVTSLLPPDHPEMICLQQGSHVSETRFSLLGILAAVLWFPLGVGVCLLDRRVRCTRCGYVIEDGLCR